MERWSVGIMEWWNDGVYIEPDPNKPEKEKTFYHEITKGRNHEEDHESFHVFQKYQMLK